MATHPRPVLAFCAVAPATLVVLDAKRFFGFTIADLEKLRARKRPSRSTSSLGSSGAVPAIVALAALTTLAKAGLRRLVMPVDEDATTAPADVSGHELAFDAVAVSGETRAAVGGMAALTAAMVAWVSASSVHALCHDPRLVPAIAAYVALAVGGAWIFRRASRVSIGLDGVHVTGTSRTRFYAYRGLDAAHTRRDELVFARGGRVVLRLQLHGKDAARRDVILHARASPSRAQTRNGATRRRTT